MQLSGLPFILLVDSNYETAFGNAAKAMWVIPILAEAPATYLPKPVTATNIPLTLPSAGCSPCVPHTTVIAVVDVTNKFLIGCAQVEWRVALPLAPDFFVAFVQCAGLVVGGKFETDLLPSRDGRAVIPLRDGRTRARVHASSHNIDVRHSGLLRCGG